MDVDALHLQRGSPHPAPVRPGEALTGLYGTKVSELGDVALRRGRYHRTVKHRIRRRGRRCRPVQGFPLARPSDLSSRVSRRQYESGPGSCLYGEAAR